MATGSGCRGRPRKNATDPPRQDDKYWTELIQAVRDQTISINNLIKLKTQVAVLNQPPPPHHEEPKHPFIQFYKLNPPTFSGGTNVMEALYWLSSLEKIFKVIQCTEEQKVDFATYMLKEASDNWWRCERTRYSALGTTLIWEIFQKAFLDRYFPKTVRDQKYMEFERLRQEDLSVEEYLTKFEELDRCSSHANYSMDEKWKINLFWRGLRDDIRKSLYLVTLTSFDTLLHQSYVIEEGLREMEVQRQQQWFNNKNEGKHFQKKQRVDIRGNVNR